jgi:hypothetical protein
MTFPADDVHKITSPKNQIANKTQAPKIFKHWRSRCYSCYFIQVVKKREGLFAFLEI